MKSASSLKENGVPDNCDRMPNSKEDKEFRTVTFDKLTGNLTCTCLKMGNPAEGGKKCVAGHDICLQDTGECGTAIRVWKKVPFPEPEKFVDSAEQMQTVSIIVEASDPPPQHPEAKEYRYGLESAGFQEFPQIIKEETLKKFKAKLGPPRITSKVIQDYLWLGEGGVKENVLKFRQQQKCFTKVGAPPETKCAHLLPEACKEAKGCYPNEVIDILDDLDFMYFDKGTNPSGEKYMFDYAVNVKEEDKGDQDEEVHAKKAREFFIKRCTVYRKNAIVQPYEKIEEGMSRPPAQYVATDITDPSTYRRMEEKPFDSENVDAKTAVGGAFPALHIDAITITDRHKDIFRVILDSARHVEVRRDNEKSGKVIGYAGTMHNYWIPIGSQSPGDKIDTCPLIFQTNDSPAKFKLGTTTIGNAMSWATEERMHAGLMVTTKVGECRRESVEFRRVDMMRYRPQLFDPLNCEILPKADCKLEVTEKKCEWNLQKRTCTSLQ